MTVIQKAAHSNVSIAEKPRNGIATVNLDGTVTYMPNEGYSGTDSFSYELCDVEGLCDTANVFITVSLINDRVQAEGDTIETDEDTRITFSLLENDADGKDLSVNLSAPSNGKVTNNDDGTATYTPTKISSEPTCLLTRFATLTTHVLPRKLP